MKPRSPFLSSSATLAASAIACLTIFWSSAFAQTTASAGIAGSPGVDGTAPSGTTPGTFVDLSNAGSWSAGVPTISTAAIFSGGAVGTLADFSALSLALGNTAVHGAEYIQGTGDRAPAGVKTITVGSGGITFNGARIGPDLDIEVGTTDQTWTAATGQLNFQGQLKGSATIQLTGANGVNMRGFNNTFTGVWDVDGSTLQSEYSPGDTGVSVTLRNAATFRGHYQTNTYAFPITLGSGGGKLKASTPNGTQVDVNNDPVNNLTQNFTGTITGGTVGAPLSLTLQASANAGIHSDGSTELSTNLNLKGDLSAHVGPVVIESSTRFTPALTSTSTTSFVVGAYGIVDGVDTVADGSLIRGSSAATDIDGTFNIDLTGAAAVDNATWKLVDSAALNATFASNFNILGFTETAPGSAVWTKAANSTTYTFTESTGVLGTPLVAAPTLTVETTGADFDMGNTATWVGGVVPNNNISVNYIPDFKHVEANYVATTQSSFRWLGIISSVAAEIRPTTATTINLGSGGISGVSDLGRLGSTDNPTKVFLNLGDNDQTWAVGITNGVGAGVTGTATVTIQDRVQLRQISSSTFAGTWLVDGGLLRTDSNNAIGLDGTVKVQLKNNGTWRMGATGNLSYSKASIEMVGDGKLWGASALAVTSSQPVTGTGDLTLGTNGAGNLTLTGSVSHNGDTIIDGSGASAMTATFNSASSLSLAVGANGVNNQVRKGSAGTGSHTFNFSGTLNIDLTNAGLQNGNLWDLVDDTDLNVSFSPAAVTGFTDMGSGSWEKIDGAYTWTFNANAGELSLVAPASGYGSWKGVNAGGQNPGLDWDNDGVANGVEYFLNSAAGFTANPALGMGNSITWTNGGNIPGSAYGTQFLVQTSSDLDNWADVLVGDLTTNTDSTLTYTLTGAGKRFVRLKVTPTE
jgi:fibronectin-binding autotransporter adhesin